jgi:iron complex outermembrane receptor protein
VKTYKQFCSFGVIRACVAEASLFAVLLSCPETRAQASPDDLANLSIEDLMKIEVTSVSRRQESLSQTAAAIFVITPEDILHSGATNIPDLLRMVPGVYVAQINANAFAICIRGFNGRYSHEVLVMVDGRTVYSPTFGGVTWDVLDLPLEDIERIEVIRGPGGSTWGANAVNGVINIITKTSADTQGTTIVAGGGNVYQGFGTLEHGGKLGKWASYRIFAKYLNEASDESVSHQPIADGWHDLRGGFRADSQPTSKDAVSVQGDLYTGREGSPSETLPAIVPPGPVPTELQVNVSGGFIQTNWDHRFSGRSATTLLISYQRYARTDILHEARGTFDADFQHDLVLGERQQIVWGLGFRQSSANSYGGLMASFNPANRDASLYSGFFQYQLALASNHLQLTIGTKLQHHYYTGFGAMPTIRAAWLPNPKNTLWASVSRALRTPSDSDVTVRFNESVFPSPEGIPVLVSVFGNPHPKNEGLLAYEVGFRSLLHKNLSIDIAAYFNNYDNRSTLEPSTPFFESTPFPPHLVLPLLQLNLMEAETRGLEVNANWKISSHWTISPGYAFEHIQRHLLYPSTDTNALTNNGEGTPVQSAQLRSHVTLPHRFAWDTSAYFTGALADPRVASCTRLDTGVTWQWRESLSVSAFGQDLLQDGHLEFLDSTGLIRSSLMPRSAYAKIVWHF